MLQELDLTEVHARVPPLPSILRFASLHLLLEVSHVLAGLAVAGLVSIMAGEAWMLLLKMRKVAGAVHKRCRS